MGTKTTRQKSSGTGRSETPENRTTESSLLLRVNVTFPQRNSAKPSDPND